MTFTIIDFKNQFTVGGFSAPEAYTFIHHITKNDLDYDLRIVSENDCAEYTVNPETDWNEFSDWISFFC